MQQGTAIPDRERPAPKQEQSTELVQVHIVCQPHSCAQKDMLTNQLARLGVHSPSKVRSSTSWKADSVFQRFYYKSTENPSYGRAVPSTRDSVQ